MVEIRARLIVPEEGERPPILLGYDGMPMFQPTVWLVSMSRNANLATATLNANLIALKLLYTWAELNIGGRSIDIFLPKIEARRS